MAKDISKKETTAVMWLQNELLRLEILDGYGMFEIFEQAKEMEKEQIIKAIEIVTKKNITKANNIIIAFTNIKGELFMYDEKQAEQYYNEQYGGQASPDTSPNTQNK